MFRISMTIPNMISRALSANSKWLLATKICKKFIEFWKNPNRFLLLIAILWFYLAAISPDGFA